MRKCHAWGRSVLLLASCWAFCLVGQLVHAGEELTVHLQSGRSFTAQVDRRTDDAQLWLRFEYGASTVWRPIDWRRVVGVTYRGASFNQEEARTVAERIKSKGASEEPATDAYEERVEPHGATLLTSAALSAGAASVGQVRSLQIDARVAHWTASPEVDGVVLTAAALDGAGCVVPVVGHLEVTLIGTRPEAARGKYVHSRGEPFPQLGSWTRQINTYASPTAEAQVQLPFTRQHPEFNYDLGAYGLVYAKLVVPGQGVFAASADLVRVRPYSPVRDQLQQLEGERFFPLENARRYD